MYNEQDFVLPNVPTIQATYTLAHKSNQNCSPDGQSSSSNESAVLSNDEGRLSVLSIDSIDDIKELHEDEQIYTTHQIDIDEV